MAQTRVNGVDLAWERAGNGPRLLFCNGSGATMADLQPMLDVLATTFEVLAYDQRGLGRSGPAAGPYAMADLAADALGLLDVLGWAATRVLGVSFGGMVAQELAVTAPGRVERLALLCTSAGGGGGSSYPLHELADLPAPEWAAAMRRLLDTRFDEQWLESHPGDRALVERLGSRPEDPAGDAGRRLQLQARRRHDAWDRLGAIRCPTLVAAGRYDGIAPVANAEALAGRISGAQLRLYEGGHLFMGQDPRALPEIAAFLAGPSG